MIRLRETHTGDEAEWAPEPGPDGSRWSGDPNLVATLRNHCPEVPGPGETRGHFQAVIARMVRPYGIVVVRETTPEELPRFGPDGVEIVY